MSSPLIHFEVAGRDPKALQSFFGELFGWKINADNPMNYGMADVGSGDVAGGIGPAPEGDANGHAMFYVGVEDRKSTRLNSSHMSISYAVFCLKKKNNKNYR